ncbi:MAG TPA: hypothetical protein VG711_12970 [Phycisphaerales bacterium]|nr:hypothetical protein [Phycisphaerales bacterium]
MPSKKQEKQKIVARILALTEDETHESERPIIEELRAHGINVFQLSQFNSHRIGSKQIVPILLEWLGHSSNYQLKRAIALALCNSWARGTDAPLILIDEFKKVPSFMLGGDPRWELGLAIEHVADERIVADLVELVSNRNLGPSRELLILALGRVHAPHTIKTLVDLLNDTPVCYSALQALSRFRSLPDEVVVRVQGFAEDADASVSKLVKRILKKHARQN